MESLTPGEMGKVDDLDDYHRGLYAILEATAKQEYERATKLTNYTIKETPDVEPLEILSAIVAEYKGNVVLFDFWATWCGPCMEGINSMKSIKPELQQKGVTTVYITTTSSPHATWMKKLPDIGGVHYYLTADQWREILSHYGFDGIPSYILYNREGDFVEAFSGFQIASMMRARLEKVW